MVCLEVRTYRAIEDISRRANRAHLNTSPKARYAQQLKKDPHLSSD